MARRRSPENRWEADNQIVPNPAAFVVVALLIGAVAGLALLFALVL